MKKTLSLLLVSIFIFGCSSQKPETLDISPIVDEETTSDTVLTPFLTDEELSQIQKENQQNNAIYEKISQDGLSPSNCNNFTDTEMKNSCLDSYYFNLAAEQNNVQACQNIIDPTNKQRCTQELSNL